MWCCAFLLCACGLLCKCCAAQVLRNNSLYCQQQLVFSTTACIYQLVYTSTHTSQHATTSTVKYYNPLTSVGLVRCARDQLVDVKKAVEALRLINGKQVVAHVDLVSGMCVVVCVCA